MNWNRNFAEVAIFSARDEKYVVSFLQLIPSVVISRTNLERLAVTRVLNFQLKSGYDNLRQSFELARVLPEPGQAEY